MCVTYKDPTFFYLQIGMFEKLIILNVI